MRDEGLFAVVTGGGTSGHIVPALAVLEELEDAGYAASSLGFVGTSRGVDRSLMEPTPYRCAYLPVSGLQRSLRPSRVWLNLLLPYRLLVSRVAARRLIRSWAPRVVVSVGGYASEPMSRAAIAAGVPLVCISYDRIPGLATRRQARRATLCAVAFPDSPLPRAVPTGAPVRRAIRRLDRDARRADARRALGVPEDCVLLAVTGGSLGSATLNDLVPRIMERAGNSHGLRLGVFHVCGPRNEGQPVGHAPNGVWYRRVGYESRMVDLYAAADLFLCRAGASTVAEIAATGVPAVVVPWPGAADDHQALNASWLSDAGAALVLTDDQCASVEAVERIVGLLADGEALGTMSRNALALGKRHPPGSIAGVVTNAAAHGGEHGTMGTNVDPTQSPSG